MRSTNLPLFDLFQRQRRYVVPLFQRPYVWEQEEQWEPLWQDIAGRAEAVLERDSRGSRSDKIGSHFLGAIVLNQIKVYGRQVDTVEVIDGQQRLTTLQLMLAAFRDEVKRSEEKRLCDDLDRLTENDGVRESEVERFKVWPTNADRRDFDASMAAGAVVELEKMYPLQRLRPLANPATRPPTAPAGPELSPRRQTGRPPAAGIPSPGCPACVHPSPCDPSPTPPPAHCAAARSPAQFRFPRSKPKVTE